MTSSTSNEAERAAQAVFVLFASVYDSMTKIRKILSDNPAVTTITQDCEVCRFSGDEWVLPDGFFFEVYVDTTDPKTGNGFCWSFDLSLRSGEWTLKREIQTPGRYTAETISNFATVIYASFAELQDGYAPLMAEFVRSAEGFTFPP